MRTSPLRAALLVLLLAPLVLAACGDDDEATRTTDRTSDPEATTDPTQGDGGGDGGDGVLYIALDVHGGFVPVEQAVADVAEVVVEGDGTVLTPAPVTLIFPGPAFPPFQVGHIDETAVGELADAVRGLDPDADYRQQGDAVVADAPDTTVTLDDGSGAVSITANALGTEGETGPRGELAEVVALLTGLVGGTGEELYVPESLRVHDITDLVGDPPPATTAPGDPTAPGEPSGRVLDWPIPYVAATCSFVEDPGEVAALLEVLADATQLDWFDTDAGVRRLVVVPVLPGDPGCTDS